MQLRYKSRNHGDTIVEVLFAISVFSLVVVGSLSIMNQGTAAAQRALEITLVRQEIDAQAETLRFLNASYIDLPTSTQGQQWRAIRDNILAGKTEVTAFDAGEDCPASPPSDSFILNTRSARFVSIAGKYGQAQTFSQVLYDAGSQVSSADGLWIEAVRVSVTGNNQDNAGYIDFHIRACWDSPGQSVPVTLGTIVRLYEPL
jgi:type II secretory pathway pseudopilin PulG